MIYPSAKVENAKDTLAGLEFADPFRWLEGNDAEVRHWQSQQAELASSHVRTWPYFNSLRELVRKYNTDRYMAVPRYAGGLWFRTRMISGQSQAQAIVS